jgi:hypothetical protein
VKTLVKYKICVGMKFWGWVSMDVMQILKMCQSLDIWNMLPSNIPKFQFHTIEDKGCTTVISNSTIPRFV